MGGHGLNEQVNFGVFLVRREQTRRVTVLTLAARLARLIEPKVAQVLAHLFLNNYRRSLI